MFGLLKNTPVTGKAVTSIQQPCEHIFSFVGTNFLINYPKWSSEVVELEALTKGPVGIGSMVRQVRIDQGNRSESIFKVTVFQTAKRICFEGVSNPYRCDYVLQSNDSLSTVTFTFELLSLELYMRPFEKLIRIAVQDGTERTVKNIKQLLEVDKTKP